MNYTEYKTEIKSGDLLAWTSGKKSRGLLAIVEYVVRLFTMSEYYHVGIAYNDGKELYIFEAVIPKVRMQLLKNETPFFHIPMNVKWNDALFDYLKARVGEKYSVLDAVRAFFKKPDAGNHEWECAELCHEFYMKAGIDLGHAWTPSEIVEEALGCDGAKLCLVESE